MPLWPEDTSSRGRRRTALAVALALLIGISRAIAAPTPPAGFQDTVVASGLASPSALAFAPDGRLFVLEKAAGRVRIVKDGTLLAAPFADVNAFIPAGMFFDTFFERGLLGIAFDPAFATTGYVYLYHSICKVPHPGGTPGTLNGCDSAFNRVVRVRAVGDVVDPASYTVLLDDIGAAWGQHNAGWLGFGPLDGKLYVAVGDDGPSTTAPDLGALNGKVLRLNADGTVPADNPFVGTPGARGEVWAYGLRNPFRCRFHPDGRLFCADVGEKTWEELDVITRGANYGWPTTEGAFDPTAYPLFTNPIYTYQHQTGVGTAIIGGEFGARTNFPGDYQTSVFFGDYVNGTITRAVLDATGVGVQSIVPFIPDAGANSVTDMAGGPDGSLYYTTYAAGAVRKVTAITNHSPVAQASATPSTGLPPLTVQFSSAGSSDADADPLTYLWDFGDGTAPSTLANPSHTYQTAGLQKVTLTVSDGKPLPGPGTTSLDVAVGTIPVVTITQPVDGASFAAGDVIGLAGSATDAEDGPLPAAGLHWTIVLHHNTHTHPYIDDLVGAPNSFTITTTGETDPNIWYEIDLAATDSTGLTGTATVSVYPLHAQMTFLTSPAGLAITLDGQPSATPLTVTGVVGLERTLGVVSPQTGPSGPVNFLAWSDGGGQTHLIDTPPTDTTYTASFVPAASTSTSTSTSVTSTTSSTSTSTSSTSSTSSSNPDASTVPTSSTTTSSSTSSTIPAGTCALPNVIPAAGGVFTEATTGASAMTGTCGLTDTAPEYVFQWTPDASGMATIQTCGAQTTFDTVLYVQQGACGGGEIACNDDTPGCGTSLDGTNPHRGSSLTQAVTAGQTYYIVVDGYEGQAGSFTLSVSPPAAPTTSTTSTSSSTSSTSATISSSTSSSSTTSSQPSTSSTSTSSSTTPSTVPTSSSSSSVTTSSSTAQTVTTVSTSTTSTTIAPCAESCDDGDACTVDTCDRTRGCLHTPQVSTDLASVMCEVTNVRSNLIATSLCTAACPRNVARRLGRTEGFITAASQATTPAKCRRRLRAGARAARALAQRLEAALAHGRVTPPEAAAQLTATMTRLRARVASLPGNFCPVH